MLTGEFRHSIDAKGRIIIPAKLREDLGDLFVITKGLDNCLYVYSMREWEKLEEKIDTLPFSKARSMQRFFFASAADAEPDKQGRIVVPPALREYAGLTKDVVITGNATHAEVWDKEAFDALMGELTSEVILGIMEENGF